MKSIRMVVVFLLYAVLTFNAAAQTTQSEPKRSVPQSLAAPKLVADSFAHDFGEIKSGTPLRYAFKILNKGKADLLINSVTPG